jgi:hypothetical protein
METKSMDELARRIRAGGDHQDFVIDTELKNLANEIDARLQKVAAGITVLKPTEEWLE